MKPHAFTALVAGALLLGEPGAAQTQEPSPIAKAVDWSGPTPGRKPAFAFTSGDIDYAIAEMCFPFLLDGADPATMSTSTRIIPRKTRDSPPPGTRSVNRYTVGNPDLEVFFFARAEADVCMIRLTDGDPEKVAETARARLGQWPEAWRERLNSARSPGDYLSKRTYVATDPNGIATIEISLGSGNGRQRQEGILISIARMKGQPVDS